jgi:hypothetical protein
MGLLGDYLLGFADVVRGPFSREDRPPLPGRDISASSGTGPTDDSNLEAEVNKKEDDNRPKAPSRSIQGLTRIANATIKAPVDMTLSTAQGLHNTPKLYGDRTVREMDKVTGLGSGLKAAGKVRNLAN